MGRCCAIAMDFKGDVRVQNVQPRLYEHQDYRDALRVRYTRL